MSFDDDIDLILADGEDVLSVNGDEFPCTLTTTDSVVGQDGGLIEAQTSLLARASALPYLRTGQNVLVNGIAYGVVRMERIQDGLVLQLILGNPVRNFGPQPQ